ncbi:hypothetical protein L226DRAFT_519886 [Lentinus tigrinus ALCF2SS1-7]|uniref:Zn(2)-C6 fungal-type domain-containing protein n=1 Tax=Lentinus tigrinus ALCF2SS1-6 TaxID=1328759 RepID=A0A5C2SS85_9APHY|nr:hypothetical protein L227DRAFT_147886 [Lentinus tigrinus ALCF2SS1-6]RPD80472.1 hypothetical protein L226DRAFT_519886 [Lentinus tigrinus ALCF2SS1-7]
MDMDPGKSPHHPSDRPAPPRRLPSPPDRAPPPVPVPASAAHRAQTTLPPIHQLHPGLAHASSSLPMQPPPQPPLPSPPYPMQGATHPLASTSSLGVRHAPEDSDQDAPQKKQKRRRQALSCTECKRRKIKCDRANPCGPCVRRGEQTKCQWHIIEPLEKYVSRAEFDELKARVDQLEALVIRGGPSTSSPSAPISRRASMSAMMPMTSGPPPEPIQGTAITPYQAYGTSGPVASYPLRPASPRSPVRGREPPPPSAYVVPPPPPGTSPPMSYRPPPPLASGSARPVERSAPPPLPAPTSSTSGSTTAPTVGLGSPRSPPKPTPVSPSLNTLRSTGAPRRSSISLAELTSPYNTDPKPPPPPPAQSKNSNAQTKAPPGPRLRTPPPGPATVEASPRLRIHIVDTRKQVPV